jgi:hypothetical protein
LIAVVASEWDDAARALVARWRGEGAALIGARDLCTLGWVFGVASDAGTQGRFVAEAAVHPTAALDGVLVRRPAVAAEELRWIAAEDRAYVAAETNAFLVSWLDALPCTVLNRPSANALSGPGWSQRQWQLAAARAGVAWASSRNRGEETELMFCAGAVHGASNARRRAAARSLSAAAGAALLGLRFVGDAVAAVTTRPPLANPAAAEIVLAHLRSRPGSSQDHRDHRRQKLFARSA